VKHRLGEMSAILGIDAAWTLTGSSGVALIRQTGAECWESVAVEASYRDFVSQSDLTPKTFSSGKEIAEWLLEAARKLAKVPIDLVVADIPLARGPILGRRCADREVSKGFGGQWCSTHSPSPTRPGLLSGQLRDGFQKHGFQLATNLSQLRSQALIETYPHPALLSLMNSDYRFPYKVSKTTKYWPRNDQPTRTEKLLDTLRSIHRELSREVAEIDFEIPEFSKTFSDLKPIEDKIDALICAWVGIQVLDGKAVPYGDEEAAIWLPQRSE
jgi:predicted RNase H-like nuclease